MSTESKSVITKETLLNRGFRPTTSVAIYRRGILTLFEQPDGSFLLVNDETFTRYHTLDQLNNLLVAVFGVEA